MRKRVVSKEIAQRAFELSCRIVRISERLMKNPGAARILAVQLLRSGTSIGANLEEATAAQTKPDFITKISIARKEARETVYWLRRLVTSELVKREEIVRELSEAEQFVSMLGAIVINARASPNRGP
jgi:four helix bundle protein